MQRVRACVYLHADLCFLPARTATPCVFPAFPSRSISSLFPAKRQARWHSTVPGTLVSLNEVLGVGIVLPALILNANKSFPCCCLASTPNSHRASPTGARFACATIWGNQCFKPSSYTALAALMNIPVTIIAAGIYTFFLSDTRRPPAPVALNHLLDEEREAVQRATTRHDELVERKLSRYESGNGGAGNDIGLFRTITGRGNKTQ